jgi:hypothetical protein
MLLKAAERHKARFDAYVEEAGIDVQVYQAPPKTTPTNAVDKILGDPTLVDTDGPVTTVKAVATGKPVASEYSLNQIELGVLYQADVVLRVRMEDVLVDNTKPYGKHLFDTAVRVVVEGTDFEVEGQVRAGLPPLSPYILWVGLRHAGT